MSHAALSKIGGLLAVVALVVSACGGASDSSTNADPTALPLPTATAEVATPMPEPTATSLPPTPTPTATPPPTPTPTATPVPTPEPTATAEPPTPEPEPTPTSVTIETGDPADPATPVEDSATDDTPTEGSSESGDDATVPAAGLAPNGASIFASSCSNCHGVDGSGTGRGPSILGIGQFFPQDASPLVNLITNGGTNMPAFGTRLTAGEINSVVEYVVATFQ